MSFGCKKGKLLNSSTLVLYHMTRQQGALPAALTQAARDAPAPSRERSAMLIFQMLLLLKTVELYGVDRYQADIEMMTEYKKKSSEVNS